MTDVFVHPTAVVEQGARMGDGTRVWHYAHVMGGATVGERCSIGHYTFIDDGVSLGDNVVVQNNVSIYEGVVCEDDVFLGPSMVFTNIWNPRSANMRKNQHKPTYVGRGATIGANATILCGLTLGEYCFVGAGAVVNRDVPPYALMLGVPARQTGWMSRAGHQLAFDEHGQARCPESSERYRLHDDQGIKWLEFLGDGDLI